MRIDGALEFIGVTVPEGPVQYELKLYEGTGQYVASQIRNIHIFGSPVELQIQFEKNSISADGKSKINGLVLMYDRWNAQIDRDINVTLAADSGGILIAKDLDPNAPGLQLHLVKGEAHFEFQAGSSPRMIVFRAKYSDLEASSDLLLTTPIEQFSLVGLATGTGGYYEAKGDKTGVTPFDAYPEKFNRHGRLAAYARGTVGDGYLLQLSVDTDRRDNSKFFRQVDPDYLYTIYGDNSMLFYDAQTNRNFFAKIEKNMSYIHLGDFTSDLTKQEFTAYNRTLNGVKANLQDDEWKVGGFGSLTDRKQVQVEKRGEGISGFYFLGYTTITPGSEQVTIETRDRFHSEVLIRRDLMTRFQDYDIDYEQGSLFFKQPMPAIDVAGNPIFIVVHFEAKTYGASSYVAGGRVERNFGKSIHVGLTGITEQQEPKNYYLFGVDAKLQVNDQFSILSEFGQSSNINGSGIAYKVESNAMLATGLNLKGYYRNVDVGFFNITQSGGRRELGSQKYGLTGAYEISKGTKIHTEYYQASQNLPMGKMEWTSLLGAFEAKVTDWWTGKFRFEDLQSKTLDSTTVKDATHSSLAALTSAFQISNRFSVGLEHERNLASEQDLARPNGTSVIAEYRPIQSISIAGQHKFVEGGGSLTGVNIKSTVFQGTEVFAKYEIGNLISGERNMGSIGLRNTVKITDDLSGNASFEQAKSFIKRVGEIGTQDHYAISGGLEYLPKSAVKASAKVEFANDYISRKINYFIASDYRFHNDFGFIFKYRLANDISTKSSGYRKLSHLITGLAYRPTESNDFNAIAKFEIKGDANRYLQPYIDNSATIFSLHAYTEPVRRFELAIKTAFKLSDEESPTFASSSHTFFGLIHANYNISEAWSVGAEYRGLHQIEANDLLNGYSVELGYAVAKNLRLTTGYNFKGYKEQDLIDYSLWSKGPFVSLSFKFDQDLFGLSEAK
ncbi:MAG: hypothetical protein V1799_19685 [bacterium]